jgi:hypothetical protein
MGATVRRALNRLAAGSEYSIANDPLLFPPCIPVNGRYLLTLIAGYFDESTDADSSGFCFTIAGFVADLESAIVLELRWRDLLKGCSLQSVVGTLASEVRVGQTVKLVVHQRH